MQYKYLTAYLSVSIYVPPIFLLYRTVTVYSLQLYDNIQVRLD